MRAATRPSPRGARKCAPAYAALVMLYVISYAPPIAVTVPPYWYALAAVLILTPLYFLLSRPRKKRADARWKG